MPIIGMIHARALPGTPRHALSVREIVDRAVEEAGVLAAAGFDGLIVENMHDVPYLRRAVGPEIVAMMTRITAAVCDAVDVPVGVQVLAGANHAALAVAHAAGASFIRAEGFVFASVADEGVLDEADAGPLLRYRRLIGAGDVAILADIHKKHASHAITSDLDIAEVARAAAFFGVDGVVVTGITTGAATSMEDLDAVRSAVDCPVLVGSGVTQQTCAIMLEHADGVIVGSALKRAGHWSNPIDARAARDLVAAAHRARSV